VTVERRAGLAALLGPIYPAFRQHKTAPSSLAPRSWGSCAQPGLRREQPATDTERGGSWAALGLRRGVFRPFGSVSDVRCPHGPGSPRRSLHPASPHAVWAPCTALQWPHSKCPAAAAAPHARPLRRTGRDPVMAKTKLGVGWDGTGGARLGLQRPLDDDQMFYSIKGQFSGVSVLRAAWSEAESYADAACGGSRGHTCGAAQEARGAAVPPSPPDGSGGRSSAGASDRGGAPARAPQPPLPHQHIMGPGRVPCHPQVSCPLLPTALAPLPQIKHSHTLMLVRVRAHRPPCC
jgi:hypothetical protein